MGIGIEKVSVDLEMENIKPYWLVSIFCILQVIFIFTRRIFYRFNQGLKPFFIK